MMSKKQLMFKLTAILQFDYECDHCVHAVVKDLQTTRRLDVALGVLVQANHRLLAYLTPCVVWHKGQLSFNDLSSDLSIVTVALVNAHFSQILSETCLDLI